VGEVTAALAFDPENAEARRLLVRLFVEVPSRMAFPAIYFGGVREEKQLFLQAWHLRQMFRETPPNA
jgi:hypothetical protein